MSHTDRLLDYELTDEERFLLSRGLVEWGGPCYFTDSMAVAMGFESVADFFVQQDRILTELDAHRPLSGWDWKRTLLATEIAFASDVFGSGVEWSTTTGLDDARTIEVLRALQRKLVRAGGVLPFGPRGLVR